MNERAIAVVGTGVMGSAMARSPLRAGFDVRVWNRTPSKCDGQVKLGATAATTRAEAVGEPAFCLTMLADGPAAEGVMAGESGALHSIPSEGVWVQTSTVGSPATSWFHDLAVARGIAFVDAPVLGSRGPVEERELVVLASGPDGLREWLEPVFQAIAWKTFWIGLTGPGSKLKLKLNNWIFGLVVGLAESVALARALHIDPRLFLAAIDGSAVDSPYAHLLGGSMIEEDFPLNFLLRLAHKDAALVREAARAAQVDLPLNEAEHSRFAAALSLGLAD